MSWIGAIFKAIGSALAWVFVKLLEMGKKPQEKHFKGGDKETRDAIDDDIGRAAGDDK